MFKKNKLGLITICSILCLSFFITDVHALDLTRWEMQIEKDIMDDYKIRADEKNVNYMKDQDSKVGDVVEVIYEEGTTRSGDAVNKLDLENDMDKIRKTYYTNWANLLAYYIETTGWTGGTNLGTGDKAAQYVFVLDSTGNSARFSNYKKWTTNEKETFYNYINPLTTKVRKHYATAAFTVNVSRHDDEEHVNYTIEILSPSGLRIGYATYTGSQINEYNSTHGTGGFSGIVESMIAGFNGKSVIVSDYVKNNKYSNLTTGYLITSDLYQDKLYLEKSSDNPEDGQTASFTYSYRAKAVDTIIPSDDSQLTSSWTYAVYYDLCLPKDSSGAIPMQTFYDENDEYYIARKSCLEYLNSTAAFNYVRQFKAITENISNSITEYLDRASYKTPSGYTAYTGKAQTIIYNGATFQMPSSYQNIYLLGTTAYYWEGYILRETPADDLYWLDLMLSPGNPVGNIIATDGLTTSESTKLFNAVKRFAEKGSKSILVEPQKAEVLFDDKSVDYTSYLTTSCIIANPLDRYEFWAQNVSNEEDRTYYGEAIQVLADEKNTDGYLSASNHTLKLNPNSNWGIYLFSRYKYVNYIYKIYYGFYGSAPQMKAIVTSFPAKYAKFKVYSAGQSIAVLPQIAPNMYGWFWRYTYSTREISGGAYVTADMIAQQETLIRDRIMQNVEADNDIRWLDASEISANGYYVENNQKYGYGDIYTYKNAVRAETIYYEVIVPFIIATDASRTADDYIVSIGDKTFDCNDAITLCECDDEVGGCNLSKEDLVISATITN